MPFPSLLCIAFASGIATAVAGRSELRLSPRPTVLTRSFAAFMVFAGLVLVPISAYFYIFHGDWFLLYVVDVRRIPSAVALVAFGVEAGIGALGFLLGAVLIRAQRDAVAVALSILSAAAAGLVIVPALGRLSMVGSFAQFRGSFGLTPYGSGPLVQGTVVMAALLGLGLAGLLARLLATERRGG